ncbi:exonuclease domain-containing protein [Desulfobotulus sp. H1]|uniref:Exonuclease domain-containing protein n=1 Tax=Desulfobotulus pelophilus TaxID=2823377 RepID=A0ABT3NCR2_9BACT|nr:exodeoxyribonuclease I [Desulfobotulus pelophilus]MCW7755205.1 exonuclease domain-containing protein [Desulfobotulus pelophilus]
MGSYLFYDLETSGLNPAFDQILQFAAIRTDFSFQELERHEIRIRLRPDVLIAPGALITHRIPLEVLKTGETEYDAIQQIHRMCNAAGTVSLGYNSLSFDDIFLRFSFYRNLMSPYTHQFASGCSRMDVFPLTVFFLLFRPEVLRWPERGGRVSLKLENLIRENKLAEGMAHDAMVDVEATLALARILAMEKDMWEYLIAGFDKKKDGIRMDQLPEAFQSGMGIHPHGILAGPDAGSANGYLAPVLGLGRSLVYGNQTLWLRLDDERLPSLDPAEPEKHTFVIRKKNGESPFILPPAARFWDRLSDEKKKVSAGNLAWLQSKPELVEDLAIYYREYRYPEISGLDPDASLYQKGFFSRSEEALCRRFHMLPPAKKSEMISDFPPALQTLAARILFRNGMDENHPLVRTMLSRQIEYLRSDNITERLRDWRGEPRRTAADVLQEIGVLREQGGLDAEQIDLLESLETDLHRHVSLE